MAHVRTEWGENSKVSDIGLGPHYRETGDYGYCTGLDVLPGEVVTFYEKNDRTGWQSYPFYEGHYPTLKIYGPSDNPNSIILPGCIVVESTPLTLEDFVRFDWGHTERNAKGEGIGEIPKFQLIPIGDRVADIDYDDNEFGVASVPFGMTIECYKEKTMQGNGLLLSGQNEQGRQSYHLADFGYSQVISGVKVMKDDWVEAGVALTNPRFEDNVDTQRVGYTKLNLNSEQIKASQSITIGGNATETTSEQWGIGGSAKVSIGYEAGKEGGIDGSVVKNTAGLEVEVRADYGQGSEHQKQSYWEASFNAERETVGQIEASVVVRMGRTTFDAERKYRNVRTGKFLVDKGIVTYEHAISAVAEVH